jgi:hypothetical protein
VPPATATSTTISFLFHRALLKQMLKSNSINELNFDGFYAFLFLFHCLHLREQARKAH